MHRTRPHRRSMLLLLSLPLVAGAPLHAAGSEWILVSQTRSLLVRATADRSITVKDEDTAEAPDFGPFVDSLDVSATVTDAFASASASQDSSFFSGGIRLQGGASGSGQTSSFNGFGAATAVSLAHVVFDLAEPMTWSLTGSVSSIDDAVSSVQLFDATTTYFSLVPIPFGPSPNGYVGAFGTLPAGRHELRVRALMDQLGIIGAPVSGSADYELVFRLGDPGAGFCFGAEACPCGNDDASGSSGCINSTGSGARLLASGSSSFSGNDLVLEATGFPPGESALFFMGDVTFPPVLVGDGLACTGGLIRFLPGMTSPTGEFSLSDVVGSALPGQIGSGVTRHFQAWSRDTLCGPPPAPCPSPCGQNSNLSNGYSVSFTP